jgi:hypothetical protein
MNTQPEVAGSGPVSEPESQFEEFVVKRDNERPLSFAGVRLAKASQSPLGVDTLEAAVYRTRGGKFITTLAKRSALDALQSRAVMAVESIVSATEGKLSPTSGYNKAAVHDTFESAVAWFRPGRLTDAIREQLGVDKPIRID